jgi:hypothetical protein
MTAAAAARAPKGKAPSSPVSLIHRLEGGGIALAAVVFFVLDGFAWWWLLALFLVFDLSAAGYVVSNRAGARGYNLVHNFVAPAIFVTAYGSFFALGLIIWPLAFVAGCWFFHVGLDRALGYGPRPAA